MCIHVYIYIYIHACFSRCSLRTWGEFPQSSLAYHPSLGHQGLEASDSLPKIQQSPETMVFSDRPTHISDILGPFMWESFYMKYGILYHPAIIC